MTAIKRAVAPMVLAGALAFLAGFPSAHAEVSPAETFVQQSVDKGYAILKDTSLAPRERQERLRSLLRSIIDFKRVFRVRKTPDGHDMIADILVGGVSIAVTQRDEFASYLQQHGGDIGQLSAELERRITAK